MNYYRHHLGDYSKDTAGLSLLEHGAYRLLLDAVYSVEKPIVNLQSAYRICGASSRKERDAVRSVISTFFVETSEGFTNKRAELEILAYQQRAKKAKDAGEAGAAKRWHSEPYSEPHSETMANPIANPIQNGWRNDSNPNSQESNSHKDNQETQERKKQSCGQAAKFVPPTVAEVKAYCDERRNAIDPQAFVDFYTSKGWLVGKSRMRDWQAAVRTWERNHVGAGSTNTGGSASGNSGPMGGPRVRSEGPTGLLAQLADELRRGSGDANSP